MSHSDTYVIEDMLFYDISFVFASLYLKFSVGKLSATVDLGLELNVLDHVVVLDAFLEIDLMNIAVGV